MKLNLKDLIEKYEKQMDDYKERYEFLCSGESILIGNQLRDAKNECEYKWDELYKVVADLKKLQ